VFRDYAKGWVSTAALRPLDAAKRRASAADSPALDVRCTRSIQLQVVLLRVRTDDHSVWPIRLTFHVIAGLFMAAQDACRG
jgi:hypothetical protein